MNGKIVLIGLGEVGSTILTSAICLNLISEIAVIDTDKNKARGEILDATHTIPFAYSTNVNIHMGDYSDCSNAHIIIVTAGPSIKPNEQMDRQVLAKTNLEVIDTVMKSITKYTKEAIIIFVTNPLDIITYYAKTKFNYPKGKIFGTGTILDTARLRRLIAEHCNVDSKNVHGYVLGEHGDKCFAPKSLINVSGIPLDKMDDVFNTKDDLDFDNIFNQVKDIAFEIINLKGYTNTGIAIAVCRLITAIILNERCILPVSTVLDGEFNIHDVALSLPCIITNNGVERVLETSLSENEITELTDISEKLKLRLEELNIK